MTAGLWAGAAVLAIVLTPLDGTAMEVRAPRVRPTVAVNDSCGQRTLTPGSIAGTVRAGTSGLPIRGVVIELDDGLARRDGGLVCTVRSDTVGQYVVNGITPGTVTMRLSHPSFDTLTMQVTVAALGTVRLDITLSPRLVLLDSVQVPGIAAAWSRRVTIDNRVQDPNVWRWQGFADEAASSTGEPDVFRVLDGDPNIAMQPEWPAAFAGRGGPVSQVLVRIDGLPVWNPVHAGGGLAAITPDAVADVTLHDGSLPAEYGGRIAGVLDIDTRDSAGASSSGRAAVGPGAARAMWMSPVAVGNARGSILLAGRVSAGGLSTLEPEVAGFHDQWADGIVTGSLASRSTSVQVVSVGSSDRVGPNDELVPERSRTDRLHAPAQMQTTGMIWTQALGGGAQLASRISSATFAATVPAAMDLSAPTLESHLRQFEVSAQVSLARTTFGAVLDALAVRYYVAPGDGSAASGGTAAIAAGPEGAGRRTLDASGQPMLIGAYAERVWGPADTAWSVTTGARGEAMMGTTPRIEPRVAASVRVAPGLTASAGLARTHQYVQSLRNPDSPYGSQLALDLPAAAGMDGMPIAQSDAGTIGIGAQLGRVAHLTVDGYMRRISGLAIASPAHPEAFAVYGFDRGSGRVSGGGLAADGGTGRLTWQAAYGGWSTIEQLDAIRYHPASHVGQTVFGATAVRFGHATQLRVAAWIADGRTPALLDAGASARDVGDDNDAPGGRDTDDGAGASAARGLSAGLTPLTPLPAYMRADVQLRHEWRTGPAGGRLSVFATLANVFNHGNVAAVFPGTLGVPSRPIVLLPRSLLAGASWGY